MNGYAGVVTRTLALALDGLVLGVGSAALTGIVGLALSVLGERAAEPGTSAVVAVLGAWWLVGGVYFASFWTLTGQTPGMRVLRLEVTSADGERMDIGHALRRLLGMVLAAIPLMAGYAMILWDPRRRGLHDKLAGTVVRYVPRPESSSAPAGRRPVLRA